MAQHIQNAHFPMMTFLGACVCALISLFLALCDVKLSFIHFAMDESN